jgi:glycosyltransferase involved in cell wall biosynthesis
MGLAESPVRCLPSKGVALITAIISTFERPDMCLRLIASARQHCPDVRLLVVDDSKEPRDWPEADDHLVLPYDSGLSAKRNAGVAHVETGWVVLLDDDFICTPRTDLAKLVCIAEASGLDIVGGEVIEGNAPVRYHGYFEQKGNHVVMRRGWETVDGINRCQLIPNFFAAKAETLAAHPWDERLKLAEHSPYFWTWRNDLKVGWISDVAVDHRQHRPPAYNELRLRAYQMFQDWLDENGLCWTDLHGTTLRCKE